MLFFVIAQYELHFDGFSSGGSHFVCQQVQPCMSNLGLTISTYG